jgi:hypothetical protein
MAKKKKAKKGKAAKDSTKPELVTTQQIERERLALKVHIHKPLAFHFTFPFL